MNHFTPFLPAGELPPLPDAKAARMAHYPRPDATVPFLAIIAAALVAAAVGML